jgi:hypothetical protein
VLNLLSTGTTLAYFLHMPSSSNKQQTSQKQKRTLTAMTMTTSYPGKQSAEGARKEQAPEPQK